MGNPAFRTVERSLACALLACLVPPGSAAGEERGKSYRIRLSAGAEYNDNVRLSSSAKEWDLLFSVRPEFILDLSTRFGDVSLFYSPAFILPVKRFGDGRVRRILHRGGLRAVSELATGTVLELSDDLTLLPGGFTTPEENSSTLVQTNYLRVSPQQRFELGGRTEVQLEAFVGRFDASGSSADRTDYGGGLNAAYELHPRVRLGLGSEGSWQGYDEGGRGSLWRYGYHAEATWEVTARLSIGGRLGQQWLSFGGGGTEDDLRVDGKAAFEVVEGERIEAVYQQGFLTDVEGKPFMMQSVTVSGGYPLAERLRAGLSVRYGRYGRLTGDPAAGSETAQTDTLLSFVPGLWYTVTERLSVQAMYAASFNRGHDSSNDFNSNIFSLGVTYEF